MVDESGGDWKEEDVEEKNGEEDIDEERGEVGVAGTSGDDVAFSVG